MFETAWGVPIPQPGKIPLADQPNMTVLLARPITIENENGALILPLFTTRDKALAHQAQHPHPDYSVVQLPVSDAVIGQRAVSFSISGIETLRSPHVTHLEVFIDPEPVTSDWTNVRAAVHQRIAFDAPGTNTTIYPVNLTVTEDEGLWVYRAKLQSK